MHPSAPRDGIFRGNDVIRHWTWGKAPDLPEHGIPQQAYVTYSAATRDGLGWQGSAGARWGDMLRSRVPGRVQKGTGRVIHKIYELATSQPEIERVTVARRPQKITTKKVRPRGAACTAGRECVSHLRLVSDSSGAAHRSKLRHSRNRDVAKAPVAGSIFNVLPALGGDEVALTPLTDSVGLGVNHPRKNGGLAKTNDDISEAGNHGNNLGRGVLKSKDKTYSEETSRCGTICPMSKTGASAFKIGFIKRTARARKRSGLSQEEMAAALATTQGTYKNYEIDRCLPHQYVNTFCRVAHIDVEWLYTGKAARITRNRKLSA